MDNNIHTEVSIQEKQGSSSMLIGEGYDLGDPRNIPGFKQTTNFTPRYAMDTQKTKKKGMASLEKQLKEFQKKAGNRNCFVCNQKVIFEQNE